MKFSLRLTVIAATVVLLASAVAVSAQMTDDSISHVPFAFTVGQATLPRDTYRISRLPGHMDVFQITGSRHSAIVIGQPASPASKTDNPRLIFNRYGDTYFLREVYFPGNVAMSVPETRLERDAAEHLASNAAPDVVVVGTRY